MSTGYTTLVDIAARTDSDAIIGLIEDVTTYAPEFSVFPAAAKAGTTYRITRRTALPTSAFRNVNESLTIGKSVYAQEVKQMYYVDCQLQIDEAIVKADDGAIGELLTQEAAGALESVIQRIGSQIYYGTTADAKGFAGLTSPSVGKWPAGGTTNSTSAWLVWMNPQGVQLVVGNDGAIALPDWRVQSITSTTTQHTAWVSNLSTFIGLQVGSAASCWRVSGIDPTDANDRLTDARGNGLLSKVPLSRRAGLRWFMNRDAAYTLQLSRTGIANVVAGPGGTPAWAPMPTELAGIPITVTDSILTTETNSGTADTYAAE